MRRLIAVYIGLMVMCGGAHADNAGDGTHVTIPDPASLSGARAEQVYRSIQSTLQQRYLEAGDPIGAAYQQWQRFNTVPYRSSVHGERFVNNFVNDIATPSYALFENVAAMPAGSIVIKDSFAVTAKGVIKTGPLFLMEKKKKGWNPPTRDWLFMAIRGDGSILGVTRGPDAGAVEFCASCHNQGVTQDSLYSLPEELRVKEAR